MVLQNFRKVLAISYDLMLPKGVHLAEKKVELGRKVTRIDERNFSDTILVQMVVYTITYPIIIFVNQNRRYLIV